MLDQRTALLMRLDIFIVATIVHITLGPLASVSAIVIDLQAKPVHRPIGPIARTSNPFLARRDTMKDTQARKESETMKDTVTAATQSTQDTQAMKDRSDSYEYGPFPDGQYPDDGPYWGGPYNGEPYIGEPYIGNTFMGVPYLHEDPFSAYEQHHYRPSPGINDFRVETSHYGGEELPVAYHYHSAPVVPNHKFLYPKYYNFDYVHSH